MQTLINKRPVAGIAPTSAAPVRRTRSDNDLISLAAPALDVVLQIRSGQIKPSNDLRRAIADLLKEMEERGATLRYADNQVQAVKFAAASFVDETVLTADFPLRDEWEKYPLQLEYFGEHLAGVKFFERLDELLKAPEVNADVIEVYYLCLLLGYKGKYKIYLEEQLKGVIENVAETLRRVGRLQTGDISPHWRVTDQPEPPKEEGLPLWFKLGAGGAVLLLVVFYAVIYLLLNQTVKAAQEQFLH
ncbi:MAG TPA: type IVB secretion system protein IcmH/DotU [Pyrinomonadaceae bacterium]|jgi:type VI secretion system protein ImpK|nr:type IVB secretion system protein IcmH/DotU [Pyrinomonadaceae bacterium]